jgi:hypothetical protein
MSVFEGKENLLEMSFQGCSVLQTVEQVLEQTQDRQIREGQLVLEPGDFVPKGCMDVPRDFRRLIWTG